MVLFFNDIQAKKKRFICDILCSNWYYKTIASRKPLRQWPCEIPIDGKPADVHEIVVSFNEYLQETSIPALLIYAKPRVILRKKQVKWCEENMKNLTTAFMGTRLHFIQKDDPDFIGIEVAKWIDEKVKRQ